MWRVPPRLSLIPRPKAQGETGSVVSPQTGRYSTRVGSSTLVGRRGGRRGRRRSSFFLVCGWASFGCAVVRLFSIFVRFARPLSSFQTAEGRASLAAAGPAGESTLRHPLCSLRPPLALDRPCGLGDVNLLLCAPCACRRGCIFDVDGAAFRAKFVGLKRGGIWKSRGEERFRNASRRTLVLLLVDLRVAPAPRSPPPRSLARSLSLTLNNYHELEFPPLPRSTKPSRCERARTRGRAHTRAVSWARLSRVAFVGHALL